MSASSDSQRNGRGSVAVWLQWLLASTVGMTALALVAARVPGRFRLLLLFAVVLGALGGWAMRWAGRKLGLDGGWPAAIVAGLMAAAVFSGQTVEAWRLYRDALAAEFDRSAVQQVPFPIPPVGTRSAERSPSREETAKTAGPVAAPKPGRRQGPAAGRSKPSFDDPTTADALNMRTDSAPDLIAKARIVWLHEHASFARYLQHRVRQLGDWPLFWAAAFWGGEIAAAAVCGTWVFRRTPKSTS